MLKREVTMALGVVTVALTIVNHVAGFTIAVILGLVVTAMAVTQTFFFPWSELFGSRVWLRHTARNLHRARDLCAKIEQEAAKSMAADAPLQHLRGAIQHLSMIEAWIVAKSTGASDANDSLHNACAVSMKKELLVSQESCGTDEEARFANLFFPPILGEALATVESCLLKSRTFKHPGKIYISSARLCFESMFFGVEICVSTAWSDVAQVRLVEAEESGTYPLRILFKGKIDLDGTEADHIDISLFDLQSVGHIDRCATYMIGSGVFGMWQDQDTLLAEVSPRPKCSSSDSVITPTSSNSVPDFESLAIIWQLERRTSFFGSNWKSPFLPHDGQKKMKWLTLGDFYKRHPLIPKSVSDERAQESTVPPITDLEVFGKMRPCAWEVVVDSETDAEGWQYAADFYVSPDYWHPTCTIRGLDHVRRRKWRASFVRDDVEPYESQRSRLNTTIIADKNLGTRQELLSVSLGAVPLSVLASTLESEDWLSPGQLMASYFDANGAEDVDIGPWLLDGDLFPRVKGKVRSVEMRMPVPPAPMCPKQTRCTSTWHVVATASKVVLESVVMSFDVPFGTYFNVLSCDTFDLDEEGNTRMRRTVAIEWLKSTWLKSQVESGVPPPVTKAGHAWAKVIKEWATQAGHLDVNAVA